MMTARQQLTLTIMRSLNGCNDLFDYQSIISEEIHLIQNTCMLYRYQGPHPNHAKHVQIVNQTDAIQGNVPGLGHSPILAIRSNSHPHPTSFEIQCDQPNQQDSIYMILPRRTLKQDLGYKLATGDFIKFGRLHFQIYSIQTPNQSTENKQSAKLNLFQNIISKSHQIKTEGQTCKICLSDENTSDNFLISPCACKGSCQAVHFLCLKQWIGSKIKKEQSKYVTSYNINKFQCEICKIGFPLFIKHDKKEYPLLELQNKGGAEIILEQMSLNRDKMIYILRPDKDNAIRIGRGIHNEMGLNDISVSRMHASITLDSECFYLKDLKSKFGTEVKLTKDMRIEKEMQIKIANRLYKFEKESLMHPRSFAYM